MALVGWLATMYVLSSYGYTANTGRPKAFHVANVIGGVALALVNASLGAWQAVVLNLAFGSIAVIGLTRR